MALTGSAQRVITGPGPIIASNISRPPMELTGARASAIRAGMDPAAAIAKTKSRSTPRNCLATSTAAESPWAAMASMTSLSKQLDDIQIYG